MSAPSCPTRTELDSFQAGDLDEAVLGFVASHVESCSTCQRTLETIIGDSVDPVLAALLAEPVANPFADEVACRNAIESAAALAEGAASVARELAPTIALRDPPVSAESEALPLQSIREYKLLGKLGEGGMGAVYKALHTRLDKVVALKVLPEGRIRDAGSVARFQREMKAVGRLDHPNIVRAMDAGEEGGTHFLVMEYVEGADLSQLANHIGRLPVADACELVRQAAVGLQEAHEHGMVHRDIKPSNLILAKPARKKSPPTLKILDLGLALLGEALSADQGLTSTGQMMGTIDYMAPEQGSDTHRVDIRADVYSLGATLYRLLTGSAPFAGVKFDTPVKKILALATKEPAAVQTLRADVPPALATIVHKMLAKDPAQRFASPEELAEALAPFCLGSNLAALLERSTRPGPSKVSGEAPTHPQLSSGSVDTAPTIDYSIKGANKPRPASRTTLAGLGRNIPRSLAIAAACGGAALVVLLGVVFYLEFSKGTIRVEINDDKIKVVVDKDIATFEGVDKKHSIKVQPGPHGLTITRGDLMFHTDEFVLTKGEVVRLSVKYLAGKVEVVDIASGKLLGKGTVPQVIPQVASTGWHGWPKEAPKPAIAPFDAKQARKHQKEWADYLGVPVEYENSIGMKFVLIPPGEFMMGSTLAEIENALAVVTNNVYFVEHTRSELPRHKVILTAPIYLGIHEVTQKQYQQVMGKNPSHFAATGAGKGTVENLDTQNHPVESVSWNDAAEFCGMLSQYEKLKPMYVRSDETVRILAGNGYRMPTEAEWEFACRAGTSTIYWTGDQSDLLSQAAWNGSNSVKRTHPIGELKANPFGLFDVHGHVWEWVQDAWGAKYYEQFALQAAIDPDGPLSGDSQRVIRGGDWYLSIPFMFRSPCRLSEPPTVHNYGVGIRVALSVEAVKKAVAEQKTRPPATAGWHGWPKDAPRPAIAPFDARQARKHQKEWAEYLGVPVEYENSIGMKFVLIPPGEFAMGGTPEELKAALTFAGNNENWKTYIRSEAPPHRAIVTRPFYLGIHEVTQEEYRTTMGESPSHFAATGPGKDSVAGLDTRKHPVEQITWHDAAAFCAKLPGHRLPSEAEWEFACRAGTTTKHSSGKDETLPQVGWLVSNSGRRTHEVGKLAANPFGLFDVYGNVWEWLKDWWEPGFYGTFADKPAVDSSGPGAGSQRAIRGGDFAAEPLGCRSSSRGATDPATSGTSIGFRVVLDVDAVKAATGDPARRAAEWILRENGAMHVTEAGAKVQVARLEDLAPGSIQWYEVFLNDLPAGTEFPEELWSGLKGLPRIRLGGEGITDETLRRTRELSALNSIDLHATRVSDEGLRHLQGLPRLEGVGLYNHALVTEQSIARIAALDRLVRLELLQTPVEDSWLAQLNGLRDLQTLNLCLTKLTDRGMPHLSKMLKLTLLDVGDTTVSDGGLEHLQNLSKLDTLNLTNTAVTGGGLAFLVDLPIRWLAVGGCKLSDEAYGHLAKMQQLQVLRLYGCPTTDAQLLRLTVLTNLRQINLEGSMVTVDGVRKFKMALPQCKVFADEKIMMAPASWQGWPKDAPAPAIAPFDAKQARKHQEEWAEYLSVPLKYENSLNMKFILIPPGEFMMGSTPAEVDELVKEWDINDPRGAICIKSATPQHKVILTRPMYASIHEVTQKNYQAVMGSNPSVFVKTGADKELAEKVAGMDTADFAIDSVSWLDATDFCSTLSRREKLQSCYDRVENKVTLREANGYRLPSEAEWEHSCRAGTTTLYWFGDGNGDLYTAGWFGATSSGRPHAVGELGANPFGLYDLHGNAGEWVQDWWEPNYHEPTKGVPVVNPQNESVSGKSERVLRGGNWRGGTWRCRSSFRDSRDYWHRHQDYGFRVWLSVDAVKAAIAER